MATKRSEDSIVRLLRKQFARPARELRTGIGDDAAVIRVKNAAEDLVVTTDMLLEGIDFRRSWADPHDLGHKALAVNLSDLAAMGARPRFYLVALALPSDIASGWIRRFYLGMTRLGEKCGAFLAGGDLSASGSGIQITVTAIGETQNRTPVLRSGGRPDDPLLVTGVLGASAAGLELLEHGNVRPTSTAARKAIRSHLRPTPRCATGSWLARNGWATCMMDLSDGLSADLPRLCEASGCGADLDGWTIPVFRPSAAWGCDPLRLALHGGEDFELLFSVPAARLEIFREAYPRTLPPARAIGRFTRRPGVRWAVDRQSRPKRLPRLGYDHFGRERNEGEKCH